MLGSVYGWGLLIAFGLLFADAYSHVVRQLARAAITELEGVCGDLNDDRNVNVFDAIIGLQMIVGNIEPSEEQLSLGDVTRDGAINVFDVVLTLQHIVGKAQIVGCGPPTEVSINFALEELSESGQSGTATLTDKGTMTQVELSIPTGALETELTHIHSGQCGESLGGVVFPLTSFVGGSGSSSTLVEATLDSLMGGDHAINLHKAGNPSVFTACGNIPAEGP